MRLWKKRAGTCRLRGPIRRAFMKVLGIDPGTGRLGWSIVEGSRNKQVLVACGCLETAVNGVPSQRLAALHEKLEEIIKEFKPEVAAVEELFFFKNAKTVIRVSEARGMAIALFALSGLEVFDYTPLQIKQTVTGYGRAEKQQVQLMVKSMLKLVRPIKPDDAADAVAVAVTHLVFNQALR
jgi:crossover junction endodeoxyribonuclease RuvC